MSIMSSWKCSKCGEVGFPCSCVSTCEKCGFLFNNRSKGGCLNRVHQFDAQVENALRNGYWRVDEYTGKLYKTHAFDINHIYRELDKGNVFFSRKEFNQLISGGLEK